MPADRKEFDEWEIRLRHQVSRRQREAGPAGLSRPADRDIAHLLNLLDVVRAQLAATEASRDAWKREAKQGAAVIAGPAYLHIAGA